MLEFVESEITTGKSYSHLLETLKKKLNAQDDGMVDVEGFVREQQACDNRSAGGRRGEEEEEEFDFGVARGNEDDEEVIMESLPPDEEESRMSRSSYQTRPASGGRLLDHRSMGVGTGRAYVVRGLTHGTDMGRTVGGSDTDALSTQMEVMRLDESGRDSIVATVEGRKFTYDNKQIDPSKILLHDQESKMLLTDDRDRSKVYLMDLQREKIVQEWDTQNRPVYNIMETNQGASRQQSNSFIAYNPQCVFDIDTRQKSDTAVNKTIQYKTKTGFSCGATDAAGHMVLGNTKGELRLYDGGANADGNYKRAKTALEGLGDPLVHVTCTQAGDWILGTCETYLILFPVRLSDGGRTGFVTALGKHKPKPIMLKLLPEDIAKYNLQQISFHKAEFDEKETNILTATANLIIVWDFRAIRRGHLTGYTVRPLAEYIRDVGFVANESSEAIVTATPNTVCASALQRSKKSRK
eukprot:GHVS01083724.1.p1 GENE.GHVS01083724.1~~GHVS01083724.1.p1  ORF type:complete len:521 (+),score=89.70 GHVS01083724.1:164-1564(+)